MGLNHTYYHVKGFPKWFRGVRIGKIDIVNKSINVDSIIIPMEFYSLQRKNAIV